MKKEGGVSFEKVRDEIERDMDISDITAVDLLDEIIAPNFNEEYGEQVTKRMEDGGYVDIISGHSRSIFQDFESYLRTEVDLVEHDIKLVLDEYNYSFITYELESGIYFFKVISEALLKILQPKFDGYPIAIDIEFNDITKKTNLDVRAGIRAIRFDENSFFSTIPAFTPHWDYKHCNKHVS